MSEDRNILIMLRKINARLERIEQLVDDADELYTYQQAADYLGKTRNAMYQLKNRGLIDFVKTEQGAIRFRLGELRRYKATAC